MNATRALQVLGIASALAAVPAAAEPVVYQVDPRHTFPAFEADHQGGLSVWRGKIERSSGTIILDREARTGTVEMTMDMDSINFGLDDMTDHAKAEDILDVTGLGAVPERHYLPRAPSPSSGTACRRRGREN